MADRIYQKRHCTVCDVDIRKDHFAEHERTRKHQTGVDPDNTYILWPSDIAFDQFLATMGTWKMSNEEKSIYRSYKQPGAPSFF